MILTKTAINGFTEKLVHYKTDYLQFTDINKCYIEIIGAYRHYRNAYPDTSIFLQIAQTPPPREDTAVHLDEGEVAGDEGEEVTAGR